MTLVDTSARVHQMRVRGDQAVRARVEALLHSGDAALIYACARHHGAAIEHVDAYFAMLTGGEAGGD